MAKELLTDVACRKAKPAAYAGGVLKQKKHSDGDGLSLLARPDGRKFWVFRFSFVGREKLAGFGEYPDVGLAEARRRAEEYRKSIRNGVNPIQQKRDDRIAGAAITDKALRSRTLKGFAVSYHGKVAAKFRNPKHSAQWLASLQPVFEKLGARPLDSIRTHDLIDVLEPIMRATPETGSRIRQRLKAIFDAAELRELIVRNPAAQLAKAEELKVGPRAANHLAALPYTDVPALVVKLHSYGAMLRNTEQSLAARYGLEFALLTAARTNEVLGMQWEELSADGMSWVVPGERMKGGGAHTVALSEPAREILGVMRTHTGGTGLVFPSPAYPEKQLSNMAFLMILRRMPTGQARKDGEPQMFGDLTTVHGLCRASFSTWAYENDVARPDVIEAALAHRERDKVKAAYSRSKFESERRELLSAWGRFITGGTQSTVVNIDAARRRAR